MGNFWSAYWPQSHFRHHLLMCRHLPDGDKLTLTSFHFTYYENGYAVEQRNLPDVASLYAVMQEQFGLGVDDTRHGFTMGELVLVMAASDMHPEAEGQFMSGCRMWRKRLIRPTLVRLWA